LQPFSGRHVCECAPAWRTPWISRRELALDPRVHRRSAPRAATHREYFAPGRIDELAAGGEDVTLARGARGARRDCGVSWDHRGETAIRSS